MLGKDEITDVEIEQIQEKFWSADYKKDFLERYLNFIDNNKKELAKYLMLPISQAAKTCLLQSLEI